MLRKIKLSVATIAMASMLLTSVGGTMTLAKTADTDTTKETVNYDKKAVANVKTNLNIRKSASEDAEIIGKMEQGNMAEVIEKGDSWSKIKSGSVTGYASNDYLVFGSDIESYAEKHITQTAKVEAETLRVRESADTDSNIITLADEDDQLKVKSTDKEGWVKVSTSEGKGYVSEDFVEVAYQFGEAKSMKEIEAEEAAKRAAEEAKRKAEEAKRAANAAQSNASSSGSSASGSSSSSGGSSSSSSSASNSSVLSYASQFVGNPYVYGGTSLINGCDCSGFVMQVFAKYGVSLPHSSAAIRGYGRSVSYSEMQPGDVVCYDGHVGIYAGGGQLLSALNKANGITYNSVNYKEIITIRRMF
ncbi:MAG: SH3 domain-containing protein [Lachnospiraceae bacterium]|nr:SH3 domain-containing protein [Lachnospiraceae bacterium]